jgi:hypothetical protein
MATIDISMPPSGYDREIWIGWDSFPPIHNDQYSHYPILIKPDNTALTPALVTPCCNYDGIRGNVNGDIEERVNVADVVYLTAYLKQKPPGSPAPPCFEEGDANGSGTINVADVVYLAAYLKQKPPGSPPPPACP